MERDRKLPHVFPSARLAGAAHADGQTAHVLLDLADGRIRALIDWGGVGLGDPCGDLAGAFLLGGEPLLRGTLERYSRPLDPDTAERARLRAICSSVAQIHYGLRWHRPRWRSGAVRELRFFEAWSRDR